MDSMQPRRQLRTTRFAYNPSDTYYNADNQLCQRLGEIVQGTTAFVELDPRRLRPTYLHIRINYGHNVEDVTYMVTDWKRVPQLLRYYIPRPQAQPPHAQPPHTQLPQAQPPHTQLPHAQLPQAQLPHAQPPQAQPPHAQPPHAQLPPAQPVQAQLPPAQQLQALLLQEQPPHAQPPQVQPPVDPLQRWQHRPLREFLDRMKK
ncbi:early nodulin-75-like [Belonocnema kinseyi]|uniref:early nodulin-75-like n=1 Tax=Belonocnema kinseyi TaxID=2817044 RepID=UPI00143CC977|nr:early nodulin-75-like [Belonocnema kinseyi]